MTTLLFYLVVAAVIGIVLFFLAVAVFGRGEQMAALDPRTSPAELPDHDVSGEDVRKIRFAMAVRGYRMSDVDWTLDRLAQQLDSLNEQLSRVHAGEPMPNLIPDLIPDLIPVPIPVSIRPSSAGRAGAAAAEVGSLEPIATAAEFDPGALPERASVSTVPSTVSSTVPGGLR